MAKRATLSHTKFIKLQRRLNLPPYAVMGLLEMLWQLTARETPQGDIGRLSDEDIAIFLGWESTDPTALIATLIECRWLDEHPVHRLLIHDWHEHADDLTKKGLARKSLPFLTDTVSTQSRHSLDTVSTCPDKSGNVQTNSEIFGNVQTNSEMSGNFQKISENFRLPEPMPEPKPMPGPGSGGESGGEPGAEDEPPSLAPPTPPGKPGSASSSPNGKKPEKPEPVPWWKDHPDRLVREIGQAIESIPKFAEAPPSIIGLEMLAARLRAEAPSGFAVTSELPAFIEHHARSPDGRSPIKALTNWYANCRRTWDKARRIEREDAEAKTKLDAQIADIVRRRAAGEVISYDDV